MHPTATAEKPIMWEVYVIIVSDKMIYSMLLGRKIAYIEVGVELYLLH